MNNGESNHTHALARTNQMRFNTSDHKVHTRGLCFNGASLSAIVCAMLHLQQANKYPFCHLVKPLQRPLRAKTVWLADRGGKW